MLTAIPMLRRPAWTPWTHYRTIGASEGRQPNPVFHVEGYRCDNPDVVDTGGDILVHYVIIGRARGATPHPLFDGVWYQRRYPDVRDRDPYQALPRPWSARGTDSVTCRRGRDRHHLRHCGAPSCGGCSRDRHRPGWPQLFALTWRCLYALGRSITPGMGIRVILADDTQDQQLSVLLSGVEGLEVIGTAERRGPQSTRNAAARAARSEFILFLASDIVVEPGWLDAMVDAAQDDPLVGIVGPRCLTQTACSIEAGWCCTAMVGATDTAAVTTRMDAAYSYMREVDAVSGGCILMRRAAWEIGGRLRRDLRARSIPGLRPRVVAGNDGLEDPLSAGRSRLAG